MRLPVLDAELLRTLFDNLGVAMLATDADGFGTAVNPAGLRLLRHAERDLIGQRVHDVVHHRRRDGTALPAEDCPLLDVLRTGQSARCDDDVFWRPDGTALPVWWVGTPVRRGSELAGMVVVFEDASSQLHSRQRQGSALAAEQAGRERDQVDHRRLQQANDRLALLAELGQILTTLDLDEGLRRLSRLLVGRLADWCVIDVRHGTGYRRAAVAQHGPPAVASPGHEGELPALTMQSQGSLGRVLQGAEAIVVNDFADPAALTDALDATQAQLFRELGAVSALVAPLRAGHEVLGAMTWVRRQPGEDVFGPDDVFFATEIGRRAGLAIDNARLYQLQRDAAEVFQRSLLTRLPQPNHIHLAARYLPSAEGAQVGGDWYDAFLLPDGDTMVVIGDVVGHDMVAAARMAQLRNVLRGVAYERKEPPSEILRLLDLAVADLEIDTLATCILARISKSANDQRRGVRRLRWSNAGHLPPVLLTPDGAVQMLAGDRADLLLGIAPEQGRVDHERVLPPASTLLLYTDGLIERRSGDLDRGLARLRQAVAATGHLPLEEFCDDIVGRLLPHGAGDDVALIAVRLHPEDQPRPAEAGPEEVPEPHRPASDAAAGSSSRAMSRRGATAR